MIPSNVYRDIPRPTTGASAKFPLSHTAMIPWTAEWVAKAAQEVNETTCEIWNAEKVLDIGKQNAKIVYNI